MPKLKPSASEELLQLTTMVLADRDSTSGGIRDIPAYLFTETLDHQESVIVKAVNLCRKGIASHLLVLDDHDGTNHGYPGAKKWTERLKSFSGIEEYHLKTVVCKRPLNTFSEACALAGWAHKEKCRELIIIAPPFHHVRAFMSIVSAITRFGPKWLRVYNCSGDSVDWFSKARHSQGTLIGTRMDFVVTEARRIRRYIRKGDLVSVGKVLEYLKWRG